MQIARLFEIVYLLLQQKRVTASELAQRFEVSPRTVYRDIEILSQAGIPIYAVKGRGGGIALIPGFTLDRSWFSEEERREILSGVVSLAAARGSPAEGVVQKMGALFRRTGPPWVEVDFSDWGKNAAGSFELLRQAILERRVVTFSYYSREGIKHPRRVEPWQLWFKHRFWYLRGYCLDRRAPRLFKLYRMRDLQMTDNESAALPDLSAFDQAGGGMPGAPRVLLELHLDARLAYRVRDEFGDEQVHPQPDGSFIVRAEFIEDDWVYGYLLTFGPGARVLAPERVGRKLAAMAAGIFKNYAE